MHVQVIVQQQQNKMLFLLIFAFKIAFAYNISFCTTFKCPDLSKHNITCKQFRNEIDCLRSIDKNETHFGSASPYTSIIATQILPNLEIVGEARHSADSPRWLYEIVVLTNKAVSNFGELRGFSYCNKGLGSFTYQFVIDGLERAILKRYKSPVCLMKSTFAEEQLCDLNEFFGPSCRAGLYKAYTTQSTYSKLCQLCPENGCNNSGYPEEKCLQQKHGAVVVTTLDKASLNSGFYYLCQNGSTITEPCFWYKQPNYLIFTHKSLRQIITARLNGLLSIFAETLVNTSFVSVLNANETHGIIPTLKPYQLDLRRNKPIRWCTISRIEYEKCTWLKAFSGVLIYPIECVLGGNFKSLCLQAIENHKADLMETVRLPISDSLSPIALSATPIKEEIQCDFLPLKCIDKFYYVNASVIKAVIQRYSYPHCPNGFYQNVCTNGADEICNCHSEVIMRRDDPNRENAKVLLADLAKTFSSSAKIRPDFDFFGEFNGVSDLLLQSNKTEFLNPIYERRKIVVENHITVNNYLTYSESTSKEPTINWKLWAIILTGALLIDIFCFLFVKYIKRNSNTNAGSIRNTNTGSIRIARTEET